MKPDYRKAAKSIREAVADNSHLSVEEIRKKLSDEGVDVNRFLARADEAFRKGLQEAGCAGEGPRGCAQGIRIRSTRRQGPR